MRRMIGYSLFYGVLALVAMPDRALAEGPTCSARAQALIDNFEDGDTTTVDGDGGSDPFPLDDEAWALLPARKKQHVLLVTNDNLYLEGAMLVYDNIEVYKATPAEYDAAPAAAVVNPTTDKPYDVVVFDDHTPVVIPPPVMNVDSPTSRFDTQDGTDRAYIQQLAAQSGYVFYIEPGPVPLQSIAYFGPDIRIPVPQPALNVDMDADTNVESLSFSLDGLAKKTTVMFLLDPVTRKIPIPVPIPDMNPLHPPLGLRPTPPARITFAEDTTRLSATEAAKRAFGIMMQSADAISGSGALNVASYGLPLRARMLVGVRGAGIAYDGFYYVDSVSHSIKPGEYKQNFQISRDGLITQTPVVVP